MTFQKNNLNKPVFIKSSITNHNKYQYMLGKQNHVTKNSTQLTTKYALVSKSLLTKLETLDIRQSAYFTNDTFSKKILYKYTRYNPTNSKRNTNSRIHSYIQYKYYLCLKYGVTVNGFDKLLNNKMLFKSDRNPLYVNSVNSLESSIFTVNYLTNTSNNISSRSMGLNNLFSKISDLFGKNPKFKLSRRKQFIRSNYVTTFTQTTVECRNTCNSKLVNSNNYLPYVLNSRNILEYSTNTFNSFFKKGYNSTPKPTLNNSVYSKKNFLPKIYDIFPKKLLLDSINTTHFKSRLGLYFENISISVDINRSLNSNKLILGNIGFFVTTNLHTYRNVLSKNFKYLFKVKKFLYSFDKLNQNKNRILKKKSSIILHELVYANKYKVISPNPSNLVTFSKLKYVFMNFITNQSLFSSIPNSLYYSKTQKYFNNSNQNHTPEVRIPRVRFKPGYYRLWRESRTALKDSLGLNFTYQKQLTKYLCRFYKKSHSNYLISEELTLDKIVIYSRIVPDYNTFNTFFNSRMIFMNGYIPTTKNINCVVNDFIQLVISKWYYVYFRWLLNWVSMRNFKIKHLVYRKGLSMRYNVMKSRKQSSRHIPDWVFTSNFDFSDVKPFLEVDYFTLSLYLIYEPYTTYYYSPTKLFSPKINIFRLYNWKYIT